MFCRKGDVSINVLTEVGHAKTTISVILCLSRLGEEADSARADFDCLYHFKYVNKRHQTL